MSALLVGYARCSTDQQDLTAQRDGLLAMGVEPERIYVDHGLTGTNRERPGLREALAACRAADTLVVTKLDRQARPLPDARAIDDELTPRLECTAGLNHLVDFTRHALLVIGHPLSPAGAGVLAFDDGKVITVVSRQRSSCSGDPRPMPMNTTAWFLLPAGAERTFAARTCNLASQCR